MSRYLRHLQQTRFVASMLLVLSLSLSLASCATLPDIRYLGTSLTPKATATVEGSGGQLSSRRAESLLAKRLQGSKLLDGPRLAALEEAATGSPLIAGNKVTLLFDGPQTMKAMMAAIRAAQNNINLETYIFDQDELGLQFANLLIERQRAGVQVNIIYDSVGTLGTPAEFFQHMRDAGIHLVEFNPVNPLKRFGDWRLNNRDHRKILVVDGKVGFTGGINIAGDYSNSSLFRSRRARSARIGWRDTHIRIEGPAVASLQWLFLDTWVRQRADDTLERDYFPSLVPVGNKIVRVVGSAPGGDASIYKAYALAIQEAHRTIHITTPYFVPDQQIMDLLTAAARRGIEVKMIFPSVSDNNLVLYAGRSFYAELLAAGVQLYELKLAVLHAKTAVIDGAWSTVGSANLDMRSFLHNTEVNVFVLDTEFGQAMENAFQEDLRDSMPLTAEAWEQRPLSERLKEWAARRLEYWL